MWKQQENHLHFQTEIQLLFLIGNTRRNPNCRVQSLPFCFTLISAATPQQQPLCPQQVPAMSPGHLGSTVPTCPQPGQQHSASISQGKNEVQRHIPGCCCSDTVPGGCPHAGMSPAHTPGTKGQGHSFRVRCGVFAPPAAEGVAGQELIYRSG